MARRLPGVPPQPAARVAPPGCLVVDRSAGARDCADPPGIRDHSDGGGAWAAVRRGRARGRRPRAALGSLTWDRGCGPYPARAAGVPVARAAAQVADGSGGKLHIVASLGRLLEPVGLPRYAAICGGPQTAAVLQAYQGGGREGFRECRRAQERSGVELRTCPGRGCGSPGAGDGRAGGRCLRLGGGGAGACGRRRRAAPTGPGAGTRPSRRSRAGTWRLLGRSWMGGGRRWGGG